MTEKGILERIEDKLDLILAQGAGSDTDMVAARRNAKKPAPTETKAADDGDDWDDEPTTDAKKPAEVASRNRWLELTDGTIIYVAKGEELPDAALIAKNSTKAAFDKFVASVGADNNEDDADEWGDDEDDWADDAAEEDEVKAVPYPKFEEMIKLFGSNGKGERAKKLLVKYSADGKTASIKQYAEDPAGRNNVMEELKNWKAFDKAAEKVGL